MRDYCVREGFWLRFRVFDFTQLWHTLFDLFETLFPSIHGAVR